METVNENEGLNYDNEEITLLKRSRLKMTKIRTAWRFAK